MSWKYRNFSDKTNESGFLEKSSVSVLGYLIFSFLLKGFFLSFCEKASGFAQQFAVIWPSLEQY